MTPVAPWLRQMSWAGKPRPSSRNRSSSSRVMRPGGVRPTARISAAPSAGTMSISVSARPELRPQPQPLRQRGVDVGEASVRRDGEQSLRQVVVEGERRLQSAHRLDLAGALARHVRDLPERQAAVACRRAQERAARQPAASGPPRASAMRERTTDLFLAGLAALGRPVEAEEGLCGVGLASEQLLERRMPAGAPPGEALQGAIAIEHGTLAVDDLESGLEPVRDRLDDLRLGHALAHAQVPGQQTEDEEGAGHRQQAPAGRAWQARRRRCPGAPRAMPPAVTRPRSRPRLPSARGRATGQAATGAAPRSCPHVCHGGQF